MVLSIECDHSCQSPAQGLAHRVLSQWLPLLTLLSLWDNKSGFGSTHCLLAVAALLVCYMILGKSLNILSIKMGVVTSMTLPAYCETHTGSWRRKNLNCEVHTVIRGITDGYRRRCVRCPLGCPLSAYCGPSGSSLLFQSLHTTCTLGN